MDAIYQALSTLGYTKWALIVLMLGVFIDINPAIKVNPIKAIFRYLGKSFNASMETEISEMKNDMSSKIDELQQEQYAQREALDKIVLDNQNKEIQRLRWEIIDFNNGIINGIKHSREQYRHVLDAYERYNNIISDVGTPLDEYFRSVQENGNTIKRHYEDHKDTNELYF